MRRPSVHRYLGLELTPGLADILQGRLAWRECVRQDVSHGLDVITAGKTPPSPGDLLDSAACTRLFDELRVDYDLIVFDVPPALAVADIDNIASRLDAVLLLAKSNKISGPIVGAAANRLRQVGANLIGTVLNAVNASSGGTYGYGYGYGYGDKERERKTGSGRLAG
jgi:capsular exopolysaccharide synthesis family protein